MDFWSKIIKIHHILYDLSCIRVKKRNVKKPYNLWQIATILYYRYRTGIQLKEIDLSGTSYMRYNCIIYWIAKLKEANQFREVLELIQS